MTDVSTENGFKKKYKKDRLEQKCGLSKKLAHRLLKTIFDDKLITIAPDTQKRKFIVFINKSVNAKMYGKIKKEWNDVFDMHLTE